MNTHKQTQWLALDKILGNIMSIGGTVSDLIEGIYRNDAMQSCEDLTVDILIILMGRNIMDRPFTDTQSQKKYITTATINLLIDKLRKQKREKLSLVQYDATTIFHKTSGGVSEADSHTDSEMGYFGSKTSEWVVEDNNNPADQYELKGMCALVERYIDEDVVKIWKGLRTVKQVAADRKAEIGTIENLVSVSKKQAVSLLS